MEREEYLNFVNDMLNVLLARINENLGLVVVPEKKEVLNSLMERHKRELSEDIRISQNGEEVIKKISFFINKVLSTIEILGLNPTQYKSLRKLILSDIYNCQKIILDKFINEGR